MHWKHLGCKASLVAQLVKNLLAMLETLVWFLGQKIYWRSDKLPTPVFLGFSIWWRICLQCRRPEFDPWVGKILRRREQLPTPVFWPGELHGLYSPWGCKESDMTEWLSFYFKVETCFEMCYRLRVCFCTDPHSNSFIEDLIQNVMVFGDRSLGDN